MCGCALKSEEEWLSLSSYGYETFMIKCYLATYFVYLAIEKHAFVFVAGRYATFDKKNSRTLNLKKGWLKYFN